MRYNLASHTYSKMYYNLNTNFNSIKKSTKTNTNCEIHN